MKVMKIMEVYQKRVVDEKNELDKNIIKLTSFIYSILFSSVSEEQSLLRRQMYSMMEYSEVLRQRIEVFTSKTLNKEETK